MIALHAIQADLPACCHIRARLYQAIRGLKSKYPCGCFLFCARSIIIALHAIQADLPACCHIRARLYQAIRGLKRKYPCGCFLFCACGIMIALAVFSYAFLAVAYFWYHAGLNFILFFQKCMFYPNTRQEFSSIEETACRS